MPAVIHVMLVAKLLEQVKRVEWHTSHMGESRLNHRHVANIARLACARVQAASCGRIVGTTTRPTTGSSGVRRSVRRLAHRMGLGRRYSTADVAVMTGLNYSGPCSLFG